MNSATLSGGSAVALDASYEACSGPVEWRVVYDWGLRAYRRMKLQRLEWGRCVGGADPDAAMQPDDTLFPSAGAVDKRIWLSDRAAQIAAETEGRIQRVLARRGPLTASALCTSLALSPSATHKALRRRPDLFAVVGEKRNRRNRPVFVWGLVEAHNGR